MNISLLARYEHACALTRSPAGPEKATRYEKALDELEIAVVQPSLRIWAQADPSLRELHDMDTIASEIAGQGKGKRRKAYEIATRFKGLIGDTVASDFTGLSPFAAHRDALGLRGIHDAHQLSLMAASDLATEFGITAAEASRWLNLAQLHQWLAAAPAAPGQTEDADGRDQRGAQLLFLLLDLNLDSIARVRRALGQPGLRDNLVSKARSWDVVAPGSREIDNWMEHRT